MATRFHLGLVHLGVFVCAVAGFAAVTSARSRDHHRHRDGPDGTAFRGAFVQARNAKTKITVSVLSDNAGPLPRSRTCRPATTGCRSRARLQGRPEERHHAHRRSERSRRISPCRRAIVRWSDISMYQGKKLLPEARGKDLLFTHCMACHGFESPHGRGDARRGRLARPRQLHDATPWASSSCDRSFGFTDQKAEDIVYYINHVFGEDSMLPKSPADLPQYKDDGAPVQRRGAQDRLRRIRDARARTACRGARIPTRTARSGFPYYGARQQDRAARSR